MLENAKKWVQVEGLDAVYSSSTLIPNPSPNIRRREFYCHTRLISKFFLEKRPSSFAVISRVVVHVR